MGASNSAVKDSDGSTETEIPASYIQDRAGDVLDRAFAGERFKVTRYGNPRVYVVGAREYEVFLAWERTQKSAKSPRR